MAGADFRSAFARPMAMHNVDIGMIVPACDI
jgi:hypothetical protein